MTSRYFTQTPIAGDRAVLAGSEAHHLIHVMRAGSGTRVTLFDGSGAEFSARIEKVGRADVELAILGREEIDRELPLDLTLAVALPKGDRQKWLVEKAVELGVTRIVPIETTRSVAQPVGQAIARLQRTVIEASKQCGRNRLLEIAPPQSWADLVGAEKGTRFNSCEAPSGPFRQIKPGPFFGLVAHPSRRAKGVEPLPVCEALPPTGPPDRVLLAVGPEGGFSSEEIALATAAGWTSVDLGPRTLRIETAALKLVALVVLRSF